MQSEKSIALFTYDVINPQKIFKLLEWSPALTNEENPQELKILFADFLEDLRPNVLLASLYNETSNVTTVKLLKIKS